MLWTHSRARLRYLAMILNVPVVNPRAKTNLDTLTPIRYQNHNIKENDQDYSNYFAADSEKTAQ